MVLQLQEKEQEDIDEDIASKALENGFVSSKASRFTINSICVT